MFINTLLFPEPDLRGYTATSRVLVMYRSPTSNILDNIRSRKSVSKLAPSPMKASQISGKSVALMC